MRCLDRKRLEAFLSKKGTNLSEFAKLCSISRQSLYNMFKGRQIFSKPFEKILNNIDVAFEEITIERSVKTLIMDNAPKEIKSVLDLLVDYAKKNKADLFLIGSRAKGKKGIRSDWDFAIYFSKQYAHARFSVIKDKVLNSSFPYRVDLANLNAAPDWFIESIENEAIHLFGNNPKISRIKEKLSVKGNI